MLESNTVSSQLYFNLKKKDKLLLLSPFIPGGYLLSEYKLFCAWQYFIDLFIM